LFRLQALVVQLGCMAYEFYLLQRCNVSHMRMYSVFLALPSATVRLMASRQLQVDDDSREEVDEDDMELAEAAAGAGGAGGDPAAGNDAEGEKKQKSVRMIVEGMLGGVCSSTAVQPKQVACHLQYDAVGPTARSCNVSNALQQPVVSSAWLLDCR
jgi:hypothetical protein